MPKSGDKKRQKLDRDSVKMKNLRTKKYKNTKNQVFPETFLKILRREILSGNGLKFVFLYKFVRKGYGNVTAKGYKGLQMLKGRQSLRCEVTV